MSAEFKPVLEGIDSVASFIIFNEQSESNPDCSFHSSFAFFASGRSYHQNLIKQAKNPQLVIARQWNILVLAYIFDQHQTENDTEH